MMKNTISVILSGAMGGFVVLATLFGTGFFERTVQIEETAAKQVRYNMPQGAENAPTDFTLAAEKSMPAVVHIKSKKVNRNTNNSGSFEDLFDLFGGDMFRGQQPPSGGTGSGVIISKGGYIVTNNHVVKGADELEVTLFDNRKFKADVVGTDPATDVAVLKISEQNLPTLEFANSDDVRIGEWVLAIGNPFNLTSTVTAGIVSSKGRNINIIKDKKGLESFIQTDAAVNPGNSGGALVNTKGQLVGINTAIQSRMGVFAGYSFAIPSNLVTKVVDDIIEYGSAKRGMMGVRITELDAELANELNVDLARGVVISSVEPGGAAEAAGLKANDVITEVNGRKVVTAPELQEFVGINRPGDQIRVTIHRGKTKKEITVTLGEG